MNAALYEQATGRIVRMLAGPESFIDQQAGAGEAVVEIIQDEVSDRTHYVENGIVIARPVMTLTLDKINFRADTIDAARITGIPTGTAARVAEIFTTVNDGIFEFTTNAPGLYRLTLERWPMQDVVVMIHAR